MLESEFQSRLIKKLERRFPGCVVLKNDAGYIQGIPDLLILFGTQWAALECKASPNATVQVNQPYWVETLDRMSFAAFINPSNEKEVLDGLEEAFGVRGLTRLSERL